MRRLVLLIAVLFTFTTAQAGNRPEQDFNNMDINAKSIKIPDWRNGQWKRNVPEHLVTIGLGGSPVITKAYSGQNPFFVSAFASYQYKTRRWSFNPHFTTSFGGYLGAAYYSGAKVERSANGAEHDITIDRFKSYTLIPIMLNANLHYDFYYISVLLGVDAGVNMMIGERDFATENVIYIQKNPEGVRISRFTPTARVKLGLTCDIAPKTKLSFQAGAQYTLGYKDDFKGMYFDGAFDAEVERIDLRQDDSLDPFAEIGIVFSL